jgi:hypothetical protein
MKQNILPGAAGLIALAATLGFIGSTREIERDGFSRDHTAMVRVHTESAENSLQTNNLADAKVHKSAYLVEISCGSLLAEVKIDALTGRLLA